MTPPSLRRLALRPRDGFYANDGRGWGASSRGYAVDWPWPTTIRGALTTASGRKAEGKAPNTASEWIAHQKNVRLGRIQTMRSPLSEQLATKHRLWPVPSDALWITGDDPAANRKVLKLDPTPPSDDVKTLGRTKIAADDLADARERLWWPRNIHSRAKPLASPRWWDDASFLSWLGGSDVTTDPSVPTSSQWPGPGRRTQVHVGIAGDSLTHDEGILFQHDVIETLVKRSSDEALEWLIAVEAHVPNTFDMVRLGADGRLAFVQDGLSPELFEFPGALREAFTESQPLGLRVVITTPTLFERGWLPDGFKLGGKNGLELLGTIAGVGELVLRSALVPRPLHLSGWDMAAQDPDDASGVAPGAARSTRRLVAPGAVYFFQRTDGQPFTVEDAKRVWSTPIGLDADGTGFGRAVPGIWQPKVSS